MSRRLRGLATLILAAVVLLGGCSSEPSAPRTGSGGTGSADRSLDRLVATVLFANDTLTLVGLRPVRENELPPKPVHGAHLAWEFQSSSGEVVESGKISDPRVVVSEFEADGTPNPEKTSAGGTLLELEIPNIGGTLVLRTPTGPGGGLSPNHHGGAHDFWTLLIEQLKGAFKFDDKQGAGGSGGTGGSSGSGTGGGTPGGGSGGSAGDPATGGQAGGEPGGPSSDPNAGPIVQIAQPEGECTAYTILMVGDGYTAQEQAKWEQDAQTAMDGLATQSGFADHWKDVAVFRRFLVSRESGVSDPAAGIVRDTALRVTHDPTIRRLIYMRDDVSPESAALLAATQAQIEADVTVVLVNTSEYAGAAQPWNRIGYFSATPEAPQVMGHELGHALWDLSDEYEDGTCDPASWPHGPNVSVDLDVPWQALLTEGVAMPTTGGGPDVVGAFEGALYCTTGVYRPQHTCYMRELSSSFCKVCDGVVKDFVASRTAACAPKAGCDHSECTTGSALAKSCSTCATSVCISNPDCCDPEKSWDEACVQLAEEVLGPCRGVCADGSQDNCAHDVCQPGAALSPKCSTCAEAVCKRDAYCCEGEWDWICAKDAAKNAYCSCSK